MDNTEIQLTPWQDQLIGGMMHSRELKLTMAGRQQGKSQIQAYKRLMNDLYGPKPVEELILTEGRIHGARYYCVEPVGGAWHEMEVWALDTYGSPGDMWPKDDFNWPDNMRWAMNNRKFWFRNERDRTMFLLRWSR